MQKALANTDAPVYQLYYVNVESDVIDYLWPVMAMLLAAGCAGYSIAAFRRASALLGFSAGLLLGPLGMAIAFLTPPVVAPPEQSKEDRESQVGIAIVVAIGAFFLITAAIWGMYSIQKGRTDAMLEALKDVQQKEAIYGRYR